MRWGREGPQIAECWISAQGGWYRKAPSRCVRLGANHEARQGLPVTETLPPASDSSKRLVSDPTKGRGSGSGSELPCPRGATSVRPSKIDGWLHEQHRRDRLQPVRAKWEARATRLNAAIGDLASENPWHRDLPPLKAKRAYAVARVARLSADLVPRLNWCGTESLPVACGCGYVGAKKTCRQWWLCGSCRARRAPTLEADIRRGLDRALQREVSAWGSEGGRGMKPQLVLLTLTQKHSGNLAADQQALAEGWRKLYKRMHEEHGAFPYAGVWEVTRGTDGLGHVHMHIACVWRYRDWGRIREQWLRACPSSSRLTFVAKRRDGKASSPSSVGKYLGKYLSKGADAGAFDPMLRAEVSAAFYNQRSVISSSYFFHRVEKCCSKCHERFRLVEEEKPDLLPRSIELNLYFHGLEPPSNDETNRVRIGAMSLIVT